MVLKSPVLSFLLSPRLGFGSNQKSRSPERHPQHWNSQPTVVVDQGHSRLGEGDSDPFKLDRGAVVNPVGLPHDLAADRSNSKFPLLQPQPPVIVVPDGGIGESPKPAHRSIARHSRSSFTGFFAFSSRRKSSHGPPIVQFQQEHHLIPPTAVPGKWYPGKVQTEAHIVDRSNLPSPLRTDEEDYYYSYYAPVTPTIRSSPASPQPDQTDTFSSKRLSLRQQELIANQEFDSQASSPVDHRPPHTQLSHPYAYSSPLPKSGLVSDSAHPLRHVASEHIQHQSYDVPKKTSPRLAHSRLPPSAASHNVSQSQASLIQPPLKTSVSTPNLACVSARDHPRPSTKKKQGSRVERLLSAETWWDALLSPSPRFKVKRAPRQDVDVNSITPPTAPTAESVAPQPAEDLGASFPSVAFARPRAASSASHSRPTRPTLTKSRSVADLSAPSASAFPRAGFEPELEPLADEPTPTGENVPSGDAELALPEPPLSLAQVIDEGEALHQQRAQWKLQASKSLGNKHTRSLSRARSKSLSERNVRGRHISEGNKSQSNLEFLAARTLLGSQSIMPTVHVTKPSESSSHSKPISHSHSQSAFSYSQTHISLSHAHSHSHSHSHSLTTNSSKSSRNPTQRGHSRNESWGKTALLKAGALCGAGGDDSYVAPVDERVPSSSRTDLPNTAHLGGPVDADGTADEANRKISPTPSFPSGEVGIAISSEPLREELPEISMPDHPFSAGSWRLDGGQDALEDPHRTSRHTHKSSDYAGPHPSALDLSLPQHAVVNDVSMRHRLPPRAAVQLPIGHISHPYGSATATIPRTPERRQGSGSTKLRVPETPSGLEQAAERSFLPHISLTPSDFERYDIGDALAYAALPRPEDVLRNKGGEVKRAPSPVVEPPPQASPPRAVPVPPPQDPLPRALPVHPPQDPSPPALPVPPPLSLPQQRSSSLDMVVLPDPKSPSPSALSDPPSLTASTIQMVVSAFDNPDDLDEFQDLFYKPQLPTGDQQIPLQPPTSIYIPTDVRSSDASSPLENLVRSLSEEMHEMRNVSRTPTDLTRHQSSNSESQTDHPTSEGGTKYVFMDLTREYSSSPPPMEPGTPMEVVIHKETEAAAIQPIAVVPEDVTSSGASSMLGSALEENENDTFGYPIWHDHLQAAISPSLTPAPRRLSFSVVDTTAVDQDRSEAAAAHDEDAELLSPVRSRHGFSSADAVRSSYMTTSDVSRMSGLSDFPLPPNVRPGGGHLGRMSILQAYFEENLPESDVRSQDRRISADGSHHSDETDDDDDDDDDERRSSDGDDDDDGHWDRHRRAGETETEETALGVPSSEMRVGSYQSHRTTFGGSEDMDFITKLHNVGP